MSAKDLGVATLTSRNNVIQAVRQVCNELKIGGSKEFFEKDTELFEFIDGREATILIVDWDIGTSTAISFMDQLKSRPNRELWPLVVIASEESNQIFSAALESGAVAVNTGSITTIKIKMILDDVVKNLLNQIPLQTELKKLAELRQMERFDEASTLLKGLMAKNPENMRLAYESCELHFICDEWDQAFKLASAWKDKYKNDPRFLHILGKVLLKQGKYKEAAEVMMEADLVNPFKVDRLVDLGKALLNQDLPNKADEVFERALSLEPSNFEAQKGAASSKMLLGDVNQALKFIENKVSSRELASVFNTSAVIAIRSGRFDQGIDLYQIAEKMLASQPLVLAKIVFNKGIGFFKWEKKDDALKSFSDALIHDPNYKAARANIEAIRKGVSISKAIQVTQERQPDVAILHAGTKSGEDVLSFTDSEATEEFVVDAIDSSLVKKTII